MVKILRFSLIMVLAFTAAQQLGAQCNLPFPPGTGPQGCQNAPLFCSEADFDGYCSTTSASGVGICPGPFCGSCENYHWFSFIAGSSTITLTITPSNCVGQPNGTGLQAQMYATSNCSTFTAVSNCESPASNTPITVTGTNLVIGQVYYLMIDGWAGDICDYVIDVIQGIGNVPPPIIPGPITGVINVCPGATIPYSVPPGVGISNYDWSLTPAIGSISGDGTNNVNITFNSAGTAQLCVTPSNACETGPTICKLIISTPIPPQFNFITFCLGDTWTCQGQTFTNPGQQVFHYNSWLGCDSVITCIATAIPPIVTPPLQAVICQGGSYNFAGQTFNQTGGYPVTLTAANGCDSVVTLILLVMQANAVIQPPRYWGVAVEPPLCSTGQPLRRPLPRPTRCWPIRGRDRES
ncbi:MAG: hypothetical protein IPL49_06380 [Saprospirales bacterium]|nr:hypothetical protein [Saprospirales bacterium]